MLILSLNIGLIAAILGLIRQYQMLQQNSYFGSRFLGWLKSDLTPLPYVIKGVLLALTVWAAVLGEKVLADSMIVFSAVALFFGWKGFAKNSSSIKKLVFTARIKRMLAFSIAVLVGIGVGCVLTNGTIKAVFLA